MNGGRFAGQSQQVAELKFVDQTVPPPGIGDPSVYRRGGQVFFRDRLGNESPVVVGADGAGVVAVAAAASPYAVRPTDRMLLVDTSAGPVTLALPADGGPFAGRAVQVFDADLTFDVNACTIDGNGLQIGGNDTLVLGARGGSARLVYLRGAWAAENGGGGAAFGTLSRLVENLQVSGGVVLHRARVNALRAAARLHVRDNQYAHDHIDTTASELLTQASATTISEACALAGDIDTALFGHVQWALGHLPITYTPSDPHWAPVDKPGLLNALNGADGTIGLLEFYRRHLFSAAEL